MVYFKKPEEIVKAFLKGEIDVLSIWEPYLSKLEKLGFKTYRYIQTFGLYPPGRPLPKGWGWKNRKV